METVHLLFQSYLPEPFASLLSGITFGIRLKVSPEFYQMLVSSGIIHVTVLSGMNISIVSTIMLRFFIRIVGIKRAILITDAVLCIYAYYSGAQPPAIRATLMAIITHTSILFGRKTYTLYTFFITILFMLIWNPQFIFLISFQLTCSATLGIILFSPKDHDEEIKGRIRIHQSFSRYINTELHTAAAAQLFTFPLIFWHFRQISLVGIVVNLFIGWLIAPIMLTGLATFFFGSILWMLGAPFAFLGYVMMYYIVWIAQYAASLPFASVRF